MNRIARLARSGARLLVGGIFVYAGAVKALDPQAFAGQIAAYELFPYRLNLLFATTLPYVELLAGGLLLVNRKTQSALLLLLALELVFLAILGWAWGQGLQIDCGCFRPGAATLPRTAFLRDLVLCVLTLWLLCRHESPPFAAD